MKQGVWWVQPFRRCGLLYFVKCKMTLNVRINVFQYILYQYTETAVFIKVAINQPTLLFPTQSDTEHGIVRTKSIASLPSFKYITTIHLSSMCLHPRHGAYCDEAHNAKFILVLHSYICTIFSKNSVIMSDDSLILYNSLFITAHIAFITAHLCNVMMTRLVMLSVAAWECQMSSWYLSCSGVIILFLSLSLVTLCTIN